MSPTLLPGNPPKAPCSPSAGSLTSLRDALTLDSGLERDGNHVDRRTPGTQPRLGSRADGSGPGFLHAPAGGAAAAPAVDRLLRLAGPRRAAARLRPGRPVHSP